MPRLDLLLIGLKLINYAFFERMELAWLDEILSVLFPSKRELYRNRCAIRSTFSRTFLIFNASSSARSNRSRRSMHKPILCSQEATLSCEANCTPSEFTIVINGQRVVPLFSSLSSPGLGGADKTTTCLRRSLVWTEISLWVYSSYHSSRRQRPAAPRQSFRDLWLEKLYWRACFSPSSWIQVGKQCLVDRRIASAKLQIGNHKSKQRASKIKIPSI